MGALDLYIGAMTGLAVAVAVIATVAAIAGVIWALVKWVLYLDYKRYIAEQERRRKASPANVTVLYTTPSARVRVSK